MEKVFYIVMDDQEFNDLVKKTYNQDYEFVADMECGNDTQHTFEDININPLSEYEQEEIAEFKSSGDTNYSARTLLTDMYINGVVEPGNYLITVCW